MNKRTIIDQYKRDATPPDERTMNRVDVRAFFRDVNAKADAQDLDEQRREMSVIVWCIIIISAGVLATALVCLHLLHTEIPHAPAVEIDLDAPPMSGGDWSMYDLRNLPGGDWEPYRIERIPPPTLPVDTTHRRVQ